MELPEQPQEDGQPLDEVKKESSLKILKIEEESQTESQAENKEDTTNKEDPCEKTETKEEANPISENEEEKPDTSISAEKVE